MVEVNPIGFVISLVSLIYGGYNLYMRLEEGEKFKKLAGLKRFWGPKLGNFIHLFGFTILPMIMGALFLFLSFLV